jgi:hypothetical protein
VIQVPLHFLSQATLDDWSEQGKVRLDSNNLFLVAEARTMLLTPSLRFTHLIAGEEDPHQLLGRVKPLSAVQTLGGEHYMDSVIIGDIGYTVVEGYVGELSNPGLLLGRPGTPEPVVVTGEPSVGEAEALSQLFLKTVRDR